MAATSSPITKPTIAPSPLWAVLLLTFLCSIGSGIIYGGIFFLARSRYNFSTGANFGLALLFGVAYIPGAMGAGPIQRRLRQAGITPRTILMAIMLIMSAACFVPWAFDLLQPGSKLTWPIWLVVAVYSPVSGLMWPIVESFLAGGRSEEQLRSATGRFNVTWSSAIVATMFAMAAFVEPHPLQVIAVLGVIHLACIAFVALFDASPAVHEHHEHNRPAVYRQLLTFLRVLLPVSFMFNSTLSPYMPTALDKLAVPAAWQTPVTATWYFTRVLTFLAMERWHGWHGRWTVPIFGAVLLLLSFGAVVFVAHFAPAGIGLSLFLVGLGGFGVGMGIIYAAALYYAMEVGSSGVDAGGAHESLIGLGYTVGPLCGLCGLGAAGIHLVAPDSATFITLGIVTLLAVGAGAMAMAGAAKVVRQTNR